MLHKRKKGDDHPDTLTSMNNLESTYRERGRSNEACEPDEKALEKKQTLRFLNSVASKSQSSESKHNYSEGVEQVDTIHHQSTLMVLLPPDIEH